MSAETNRAKGTLSLADYRVKRRLNEFFREGDRLTLGHLLRFLKESTISRDLVSSLRLSKWTGWSSSEADAGTNKHRLYTCPATGWKYFYATVSVDLIESDDETDHGIGLQPRYLIPEKVFELYRQFQRHRCSSLPSGGSWATGSSCSTGSTRSRACCGRAKGIEVKIYITCDIRLLNQTNISAHDNFAQTRFYSSIMVMKLGAQFGADFEAYKKDESEAVKNEAGFLKWLQRRDAGVTKKS